MTKGSVSLVPLPFDDLSSSKVPGYYPLLQERRLRAKEFSHNLYARDANGHRIRRFAQFCPVDVASAAADATTQSRLDRLGYPVGPRRPSDHLGNCSGDDYQVASLAQVQALVAFPFQHQMVAGACSGALLRFLLSRWRIGHYLPLIIDQSTIAGRWEVLWASVPFRGRALPVYCQLFCAADINAVADGSQNKFEEQFLSALLALIPAAIKPLLLFDRGYARVPLMQWLQERQVHYVIRVCKETWVRYRRYQGPLAAVTLRRGELLWWPRARYQLKTAYPVNIAISRNATAEELWYLVTNLRRADTTVSWYERRFRGEELFKDTKDQLHLETIRTQKRECVERLLFAIIVAYYALTLIGLAGQRAGYRPYVCRYRVSAAWLALRLLYMSQLLKPRMVRRALLIYSWSLSYRESE